MIFFQLDIFFRVGRNRIYGLGNHVNVRQYILHLPSRLFTQDMFLQVRCTSLFLFRFYNPSRRKQTMVYKQSVDIDFLECL